MLDGGAGVARERVVRGRDHSSGAERAEGERHVPPETATGGACVCTGGEAGAACVAGVAALCTATSGGGAARRDVARTRTFVVLAV